VGRDAGKAWASGPAVSIVSFARHSRKHTTRSRYAADMKLHTPPTDILPCKQVFLQHSRVQDGMTVFFLIFC